MSKQQEHIETDGTPGNDEAAHAEWHPYRVWQDTVRRPAEFEASAPTRDAPSAWNPFAVWKKQIKGS